MITTLCSATEAAACPVPAWACLLGLVQAVTAAAGLTLLLFLI